MVVESLLFGIIVGLAAGLSPGPLVTLVLSETFRNGRKAGIQVAISPLISEPPMVLCVLVILSSLGGNYFILGAISVLGACFLIYLGFSDLTANDEEFEEGFGKGNALLRGITTNLLNPNAYMFWLTIGGPRIIESLQGHMPATIMFVLGFYVVLVSSKIAIAIIANRSKTLIKSKHYVYVIRILGIVLIAFALVFVKDALEFAGIL